MNVCVTGMYCMRVCTSECMRAVCGMLLVCKICQTALCVCVCTRVKADLADKQPAVREGEMAAEDVRRLAAQRQGDCA